MAGGDETAEETDSTGTGALDDGGRELVALMLTVLAVGGVEIHCVLETGVGALEAGASEPAGGALEAESLEAEGLGPAEEGTPLGAGELPIPPPNFPAKHLVISGTSVSPEGVKERT